MPRMIDFYTPPNDVLRELGHAVVSHSHLDHILRLAIKRVVGIKITDPLYKELTEGVMTKQLRITLQKKIRIKYGPRGAEAKLLNQGKIKDVDLEKGYRGEVLYQLLKRAQKLSTERNRLVHGVWAQEKGKSPVIIDNDVDHKIPAVESVRKLQQEIDAVRLMLDGLTRAP